jgi:TetR/AcrR family acrAB operon transcriptional repressor
MARKTKAEAELTRHRIVECAREVFSKEGVTNTSLERIAQEAGVTRGAVYWHFRDKADLFMAVRTDTGTLLRLSNEPGRDPLHRLEVSLLDAIHRLEEEDKARQTYEVMLWKCEYVGEFSSVRDDLMTIGRTFIEDVAKLYSEAKAAQLTSPDLDPALAALETFCLYSGMIKIWLAVTPESGRREQFAGMISQHIAGRRLAAGRGLTLLARPHKKKS